MIKVKEDLTGKVFHDLVVLCQTEDYISPGGQKHDMWLC